MDVHLRHIEQGVLSARKKGFRSVRGITGSWEEHHRMNLDINLGKLEVFDHEGILLLRKPLPPITNHPTF